MFPVSLISPCSVVQTVTEMDCRMMLTSILVHTAELPMITMEMEWSMSRMHSSSIGLRPMTVMEMGVATINQKARPLLTCSLMMQVRGAIQMVMDSPTN